MSGYTVTIVPSGRQPGPRTTITVDTANGAARVSEFTVQADGPGLSAQELPAIDLVRLVAALSPPAIGVPTEAATATSSANVAPGKPSKSRKPGKSTRGARRTAKAAPKSENVQSTVVRGRRRGAAAKTSATTTAAPKREYRRMPPEEDVVAVWAATHSASKVADHFDVPRHTATGWLRRLRQTGAIDSAS
jgi:hypothetical protein